ncbi:MULTISPECIES: glucose-6-phosphate dehydrogenase assembly protein OpcA [unclassified Prochlorococcus]|uniref:glucose-6-phosphate dehydrogenase assembly protein OpcA n=1 Tax=unclassified Prochlorococcus TaxID=2627481 RepID=UPI000533714C|nr:MULTISPECIES: glucose-6-phosphate dehydrogenase assembly protein OpcA [unclassified Prochlorococcus]KGG15451.1 OpcA [Prochlorococcus sp. MIT 0602]KGG17730.1 OpcA [Prochlorococcus sp. MIT 0603]
MSPQLTLQTPLQIPLEEIPGYLKKLWSQDQSDNKGANTFCLLVWHPAWIEQKLVRTGRVSGPIIGNQRSELINEARKIVLEKDLPHSTPPLAKEVFTSIDEPNQNDQEDDLRGQHIDSSISQLQPRRLITLAPSLKTGHKLESLVAAYCPLPEEGGGNAACGDVIVLKGDIHSLKSNLYIVEDLIPEDLPSWLWWNGNLDEDPELLNQLALPTRRIIIDTALGDPSRCLDVLSQRIKSGQAVNDLNWLRLRTWRETLAMVFDPPNRRDALSKITNLDIDIEGNHIVQGLLLASWIANKLGWELTESTEKEGNGFRTKFRRSNNEIVNFRLMPLPVGKPSIHPGQIIGLRLICKADRNDKTGLCVILASESGECMRLEAGGMARMELLEEVVPIQNNPVENDVALLLESSRGTTSPLLSNVAPISKKLLNLIKSKT